MKKIKLLVVSCFLGLNLLAQNEASNWFFGENAGISFNIFTGDVTALEEGLINTKEGCASISNARGILLFYTDGTSVYNKDHQVMENGNDLFGNTSSSQSAIIVPKSDDINIYYIFTVGSKITETGFNYSVVDMTADDGLGAVTNKNVNLLSFTSEKISAVVKDCVTKSVWVITLANADGISETQLDTFYAYEVSNTGINTIPVKSTLPVNIQDSRGYLKLSPNGSKLACANMESGLFLFDFNTETGKVSNPIELEIDNVNDKSYGLEFSPNSGLLYVTASNNFSGPIFEENNNPANHKSILVQYNLFATNISDSQIVLDERQLFRGALQLGPNGKIYRALSETYESGLSSLGVINNPNTIGIAASYQHNAINLNGKKSTQGLPPFISSFFNQTIDIIKNGNETSFLPLCTGDTYTLSADNIPGATYTWTKDDVVLTETDFDLIVTETGNYKVTIIPPGDITSNECNFPIGDAQVEFFDIPNAYNTSLVQCDLSGDGSGIAAFNLMEAGDIVTDNINDDIVLTFHYSLSDAINGENKIQNPTSYRNTQVFERLFVRITHDISKCYRTAELTLEVSNTFVDDILIEDICDEIGSEDGINTFSLDDYSELILNQIPSSTDQFTVTYYKSIDDALLEQNALINHTNTTPYEEELYFRIEDPNTNCYGVNKMQLKIKKLPNLIDEETTYYCLNKSPEFVTIDANLINDSPLNYTYLWSNGDTTYETQINSVGNYTVTVTNDNGCSKNKTISVEASNTADFQTPSFEVSAPFQNIQNTIITFVQGEGDYEYALLAQNNTVYKPFQISNTFENIAPGNYNVAVRDTKNNCGTVQKQVSVVGHPKFFTPNNDGVNDTWQVYGLSNTFQPNSKIRIFSRYGKLIKELDPNGEGWNGRINGELMPSDDYWFIVTLEDGQIFKNHFSLKY